MQAFVPAVIDELPSCVTSNHRTSESCFQLDQQHHLPHTADGIYTAYRSLPEYLENNLHRCQQAKYPEQGTPLRYWGQSDTRGFPCMLPTYILNTRTSTAP